MTSSRQQVEHLSQHLHACTHCRKLIIDPSISLKPVKRWRHGSDESIYFCNSFRYTVADLLHASRDGCLPLERLVGSISTDSLRDASNGSKSVDIHLNMVSSCSESRGMTEANVTSMKVDCRWHDTSESLLDRAAARDNAYGIEAAASRQFFPTWISLFFAN